MEGEFWSFKNTQSTSMRITLLIRCIVLTIGIVALYSNILMINEFQEFSFYTIHIMKIYRAIETKYNENG